jgi:site-specific DNA-cytosine methylase
VNYYNENDPKAAAWLRELITWGQIPDGDVDERSIEDVPATDLDGYTQCHFFAGIGGWPLALRLAGWPVDRPVWTGSCPCQPFSAAGKGAGFADERHLWPAWHWLIRERRPDRIFGEQVATALQWWDLVSADLEAEDYACAAAIIGAHSVGAPHIRQRLYWMADATGERRAGLDPLLREENHVRLAAADLSEVAGSGEARELADADDAGSQGWGERWDGTDLQSAWAYGLVDCRDGKRRPIERAIKQMANGVSESLAPVLPSIIAALTEEINVAPVQADYRKTVRILWEALLADTQRCWENGRFHSVCEAPILLAFMRQLADQRWHFAQSIPRSGAEETEVALRILRVPAPFACASCGRGLAEQCRQQPADPVHFLSSILARYAQAAWGETFTANAANTFPLAIGAKGRAGELRGYGNAIVPQCAAAFISAVM